MPKGEKLPLYNKETRFDGLDDIKGERMCKKTFSLKLPQHAADVLLKLSTKERTIFMRKAILEALDAQSN